MKLHHILLTAIVLIGHNICFGQKDHSRQLSTVTRYKPAKPAILVLKVDKKSLVLMPQENEAMPLESFDPDWIKSISVLKGEDMIDIYGKEARNGVLIITFKDFNALSKELQNKFMEDK